MKISESCKHDMLEFILQGFLLGLAYVAPIGMQNLYVINTAIKMDRLRAYQVAAITVLFDITLALACFFGVGLILDAVPALKSLILIAGCIIVVYIGIKLIRSKPEMNDQIKVNEPIITIVAICFTVTWLNPQALIDGSLLLGGFRASLPASDANAFIAGVALASMTWFATLTTAVSCFKSRISIKTLGHINIICGLIIIAYGLKLGFSFVEILT